VRDVSRLVTPGLVALVFLLASCSSDVVRLPDCGDCRPVELTMNQTFEAELGWGVRPGQESGEYTWVVADPGTMTLVDTEVVEHSEGEDEFVGGVSYGYLMRLEPTAVGTTTVRFELQDESGALRDDLVEGQLAVVEITVEVSE
jgi:hypothetical protein